MPWPKGLDPGIIFQRQLIRDMSQAPRGKGLSKDSFACIDPHTEQPLTVGQLFDKHARWLWILKERGV
jgi:hypothetical protein